MEIVFYFLVIAFCTYVIWKASDGFEDASLYLGRNMSDGARGATINAVGSSLPEFMTTLIALLIFQEKDGFAFGMGATAGSALFNSAIIPSLVIAVVIISTAFKSISITKKVITRDGLFLIAANFLLLILILGGEISYYHALILLALYVAYIGYIFLRMEKGSDEGLGELDFSYTTNASKLESFMRIDIRHLVLGELDLNAKNAWILLLSSIVVIGVACYLLVDACYGIGEYFGIEVYFISVIIAAAATSIPDTILSMKDAKAGNYDDSISNALGSNLFNITFALGFPILLYVLIYGHSVDVGDKDGNILELVVLLNITTFIIFLILALSSKLNIISAFILGAIYLFFIFFVVGNAFDVKFFHELGLSLRDVANSLKVLTF